MEADREEDRQQEKGLECCSSVALIQSCTATIQQSKGRSMAKKINIRTDPRFAGCSAKEAKFVIEYVKDFAHRRAAEASGFDPDKGVQLIKQDNVANAVERLIIEAADEAQLDAQWLLYELVDNHRIARQQGNIAASNQALLTLAKHVSIDALAADKHEVKVTDEQLVARLKAGRVRVAVDTGDGEAGQPIVQVVSFL